MVQRGGFDVDELLFIEESSFGTSPTTGAWLHAGNGVAFDPKYHPTILRKKGLGHQKPTAFKVVKDYWTFGVEANALAYDTSPVYNWKSILDMALNVDGSGNPTNQPNFLSLGARVDLAADEFYHLEGGVIESFEIGSSVDERIKMSFNGIAQHGDYLTTDYVSGTATRTAEHDAAELVHGDADLWYDTVTPDVGDTIMSRLNSWVMRYTRRMEKRGSDATTKKYYREFVCVEQTIEAELNLDFDSRTEFEHFIDQQADIYLTVRIPSSTNGVQAILWGGTIVDGHMPMRELDLMNVFLKLEFEQLTLSDIA